jgi:hypothetical protein
MAMRLMREMEVPEMPRDRVFRSSRLHAVLFVLASLAGCAAMIGLHWPTPHLAYYISAVVFAFLLLTHRFVTERFHPSNWLACISDEGLFIHFRSYLNDHMAAEDATVVFLPYSDLRSARLVREQLKMRNSRNATQTQTLRWVEMELAGDTALLSAALAAECARPAAWERHWYGSSATLYKDYPVLMQTPPFLRVRWRVVPRAPAFLDALRPRVEIAPTVAIKEDFALLQGLSHEEQTQRLRDLEQRGETIAAVYMARRLFGLDLAQATKFIASLHGNSSA